jgi:hypothetical protein
MSVQVIKFNLARLSVEVSLKPRRSKSNESSPQPIPSQSSSDRLYQRFPSAAREFDADMKLRI